ncbi:glycosyltransferase family 2 protein [Candidatus Berkelbacteria bacterium]|nr:glycosyltransferase family 2 protein [Candidatus Berkelbacteria bacterium]
MSGEEVATVTLGHSLNFVQEQTSDLDTARLVILIPAYNEAAALGNVLNSLPKTLSNIDAIQPLVIDDGSGDETSLIATAHGAWVAKHRLNSGVGLATRTGFKLAQILHATYLVTLDADGQHDPNELHNLLSPLIRDEADIVLGTRKKDRENMPRLKQILNDAGSWLLRAVCGITATDSQSGYRAYTLRALERLQLSTSGYEICTEILIAAKRAKLRIREVPIRAIYTEYSKKKGQSTLNGINILLRLLGKTLSG